MPEIYDGEEIQFYINGEKDGDAIPTMGRIGSVKDRSVHFGGDLSG